MPLQHKNPYPLNLNFSHTRLWESPKFGRLFFSVSTSLQFNNSILSFDLEKINITDYKLLGGTDTLQLAGIKKQQVYIGTYTNFLTPLINCRLVYFPSNSHVGFSFLLEQNFGNFNILNATIGVPVVLINSKKMPALNVAFFISLFDLSNQIVKEKKIFNNQAIGIHIRIPFSRLMF